MKSFWKILFWQSATVGCSLLALLCAKKQHEYKMRELECSHKYKMARISAKRQSRILDWINSFL